MKVLENVFFALLMSFLLIGSSFADINKRGSAEYCASLSDIGMSAYEERRHVSKDELVLTILLTAMTAEEPGSEASKKLESKIKDIIEIVDLAYQVPAGTGKEDFALRVFNDCFE